MRWAAGSDWTTFANQDRFAGVRERAGVWHQTLLSYVAQLPQHIDRLRTLV